MGEEKEILLRGNFCAYLTARLMGELAPVTDTWGHRTSKRDKSSNTQLILFFSKLKTNTHVTAFRYHNLLTLDPGIFVPRFKNVVSGW